MRVAVMQPYLYPYMVYFALIAAVDLFIVFDCVQFPRRGRVHRAPVPVGPVSVAEEMAWLTLPLAKQPQQTLIRDLKMAEGRDTLWSGRVAALRWLTPDWQTRIGSPLPGTVLPYLEAQLAHVCATLGIATPMRRSTEFAVDPGLRGQDRVMALARAAGGTTYVNPPGGRALYAAADFAAAGLELAFMPDYTGPHRSMLHALSTCAPEQLRADLAAIPAPEPAGVAP